MRRLLLLGAGAISAIALFTAVALPAYALTLPEILPTSASERPVVGKSEGEVSLATATNEVKCSSATGEGFQEAGKSGGPFHTAFKGCETISGGVGIKCTGLGDPSGTILVLGRADLVFDQKTPELLVAVLLSPEPVHITCTALVLLEMRGTDLCLALKPAEKSLNHSDHCVETKGSSADKRYFNSSGVEVTSRMECSTNHGAFEECAELGLAVATTATEEFADI